MMWLMDWLNLLLSNQNQHERKAATSEPLFACVCVLSSFVRGGQDITFDGRNKFWNIW